MKPAEPGSRVPETVAADPHRPLYHFLPPANWLNDPNGVIQWQGQYHLFYQYNPNGPFHGTIHWGHAISSDLVRWRDLPIALAPTPGGPDHAGCFSGCAVDNGGVPTLIYTGIAPEVQCVATSDDDLLTWRKHPANPAIAAPPSGLDVLGFRDPYVWREEDAWYAVLGSGIREVGGTIFLYRSVDLTQWTYVQQLCTGQSDETGTMWECPNFFPLGDKHVLIISPIPLRKVLYFLGTYANFTFTPERSGILDDGGCYYAPQAMLDERGRRLIWGWLWEGRSAAATLAAGWNGVMSLPRQLALGSDGSLRITPVPELAALRDQPFQLTDGALGPGQPYHLSGLRGDCLELDVTIAPSATSRVTLAVRCSPDGEEQTRIVYDRPRSYLTIDRSRASADATVDSDERGCGVSLGEREPLRLRVFLDRSVLEVFANDRACLTSRIYPTRADSLGVQLSADGGPARLSALAAWTLRPIWTTPRDLPK